jgi:hypothetical protein
VFLDTKKPGDKTVPPEKIDLVRGRYQDWTVFPGQLKAFEPSMLEEEVEVVGRKLRVQENKALKESLARQNYEWEKECRYFCSGDGTQEGKEKFTAKSQTLYGFL